MTKFFLALYRLFASHKVIFYIILLGSTALFAFFAARIEFEENIMTLLPKTEQSKECAVAFGNIKVKDKVFILIKPKDGSCMTPENMAQAMDDFTDILYSKDKDGLIANVLYKVDRDDFMNLLYYGMEALPCHLDERFYEAADTLLNEKAIDDFATGLAKPPVEQNAGAMTLYRNHIMTKDSSLVIAFLAPAFDSYDTAKGTRLESLMSESAKEYRKTNPDCEVLYHGSVIEGTFNSRRIKTDLVWTAGLSLIIIIFIICLCFKSAGTIFELTAPVLYGILFAMAVMYWIKGSVSILALGIGAIVLGVAVSYCLHVLTHHKFVSDPETVVKEQARPVCLGCLTTIGAFAGLLFTSSVLLKDFGIFASLALVGTTFFSLAFLPQFFSKNGSKKNEKAFEIINKVNSYSLHRNKPVVITLIVVCIVSICFAGKVKFDNDLNHIAYREPKVAYSESLYNSKVNSSDYSMYFGAFSSDIDSAVAYSHAATTVLDSLKESGKIIDYSNADRILIPKDIQAKNIRLWKKYWTPARIDRTYRLLQKESRKHAWNTDDFNIPETFKLMAEADYEPVSIYESGALPESVTSNFVENNADGWLVFTSVLLNDGNRKEVSDVIANTPGMIVLDPFYYTGDMVELIHNDFDVVLLISSVFVFIVLLLSFKSLVVSIIAFLPMMLSWYIVQGIMAIFGMQFNLINIMISTFIFGIGVDYSIFVMDGLITKAKIKSSRLLVCHKAAISFSALALLTVTCSLMFAVHPAIRSIGFSTLIGMSSTILLTYAIQPLLFKLAIKNSYIRKRALRDK